MEDKITFIMAGLVGVDVDGVSRLSRMSSLSMSTLSMKNSSPSIFIGVESGIELFV